MYITGKENLSRIEGYQIELGGIRFIMVQMIIEY